MPLSRSLWVLLGATSIVFHLSLIFSGLVPNLVSRPLHMALALPWVFLFASQGVTSRISGAIFSIIGIACCLFIVLNESALSDQYGYLSGSLQTAVAGALLLIVLEMARRAISWPLPLVAGLALVYGIWGQHLPGEFGHPGLPLQSFLGTLVITEGGLWGKLTGISVSMSRYCHLWRRAERRRGRSGIHESRDRRGRSTQRRGCQGLGAFFSAFRIYLRFRLSECRINRRDHHASHDSTGLSETHRRRR